MGPETKTRIILIRHGESKANIENEKKLGAWYETDDHLTPKGRSQIKNAGKYLMRYNPRRIFCSDTQRAIESAEILSSELGLRQARVLDNLKEQILSDRILDKKELLTLKKNWRQGKDFSFQGGETTKNFLKRVWQSVQNSISNNKSAVIVSHEGVISVIMAFLSGRDIVKARLTKINFGEGSVLEFENGRFWALHAFPEKRDFYLTLPYRKTLVGIAKRKSDGKILIVHKKKHPPGIWTFPGGGKKNSDRSSKETLKRELKEELGLEEVSITKKLKYRKIFDWPYEFRGHKGCRGADMEFFMLETDQSRLEPDGTEIDKFQFVPADKIGLYIDFDFEYGYGRGLRKFVE
jgi:broad specificity phosphatase PhoE